jgi:hypothetical protein
MRASASLAVIFFLFVTSCSPPASSTFLAAFNPVATLNMVGGSEGITYFNGSAGVSSGKDWFSGVRIDKHWTFTFQGSHTQLSKQLDQFRAEVESQLTSSGCAVSGRGRWSGNFSGFSFEYSSGSMRGFIRVSGVSFESGSQGIEILVYEH